MRFTSSVACAGLLLFAAIAWALFARVDNVVNVALAAGHESSDMTIVRILPDKSVAAGAGLTHRTRLRLQDTGRVLRHERIGLLVGTFSTRPNLERAELAFEGTSCVYRTAPGSAFPNNDTIDFVRGEGCMPVQGTPTGAIQLTVLVRNHARIVLWTHTAPAASVTSETMFVESPPDPARPEALVVSGRLVDPGAADARHRRVELLAYVWQVGSGSWWIWIAVALATLAISGGFLGLWNPVPSAAAARVGATVRGLSAFLVAAGTGILYAVLTPPFQAPDEPHHFVAFAEVAGRPELVTEADDWAALGHVTRIRFRTAEQFTPTDVGKAEQIRESWHAPANSIRGGGVHFLWSAVAPLLRSMSTPRVFLSLRLTHALFLAVLVGCFVALVVRYGQVPSGHLLAFPVLVIPTLPFFGMHVSNHAPVIAAYVLIASGLAMIFLCRKREHISALLVGVGWAMAIALSRSAMPLAPLIGAVAGAGLLLGPPECRIRSSAFFWGGLVVPVTLVLSMSDVTYLATNARLAGGMMPEALRTPIHTLTSLPWLLTFAVPLLAGLESAICRLRARTGRSHQPVVRAVTRWAALAAAAVVAVVMIGSIFVRYPVLATIDALNRPPGADYARDALWAGLTMLRLGEPDYWTSVTFWGGFGWLETLPSKWFVSLLTGATGVALIALLIHIAKTADSRRAFLLAAAVAGYSACLAAYALTLSQVASALSELKVELAIDLSGRYVIGLYLPMVVLCWSGISLIPGGPARQRLQSAVSVGCMLACTGIHAYCLRLILYRYF